MAIRKRKPVWKGEKHPFILKIEAVAKIELGPSAQWALQEILIHAKMTQRRPQQRLTTADWRKVQADCSRCGDTLDMLLARGSRNKALALSRRYDEQTFPGHWSFDLESISKALRWMTRYANEQAVRLRGKKGPQPKVDLISLSQELFGLYAVCGGEPFVYWDEVQGFYSGPFLNMVTTVADFIGLKYQSKNALAQLIKKYLPRQKRMQMENEYAYLRERR
jgi:hypothetical protein